MDHDFWRRRWEKNEIAFHEGAPNALFVKHFSALSLSKSARVFVPLCGKARDIHWLLAQGCRVVGAELQKLAVEQLFDELGVTPQVTQVGALTRYAVDRLDVFQGDIFELTASTLGAVDATYDRAALVALPAPMRARYAPHVIGLTAGAPQMLICFEYDQTQMDGPPFSVSQQEVQSLYGAAYKIDLLERIELPHGLKGKCPASETIALLRRA